VSRASIRGLSQSRSSSNCPNRPAATSNCTTAKLVSPPPHDHKRLERRVRRLLDNLAESSGYVCDTDYAYRPLPEHEVWVADVVCILATRDDAIDNWLEGSPELVIEIKSPSNTRAELHDKAMTTLAGDRAVEFWIVDPETRSVTVFSKRSGIQVYSIDQAVRWRTSASSGCT
jgi:Uma2 family endonuclease